jgi:hypothetical protein
MTKNNIYKISIIGIVIAACLIFIVGPSFADDAEDNIQRLPIADFEIHPTALGGKIGVYGAATPYNWQSPGNNFSWFYGPTIMPFDIGNVHSGSQSFRLVNMRSSPNWASMGINLGPILDPTTYPMRVGSIDVSGYNCLEFWVKGAGAAILTVLFRDAHCTSDMPQLEISIPVAGGGWTYVAIPIGSISGGVDTTCLIHIGFDVGSLRGNSVGAGVFIDDVAFSRATRQ